MLQTFIEEKKVLIFSSFNTFLGGRGQETCQAAVCADLSSMDNKVKTRAASKMHFPRRLLFSNEPPSAIWARSSLLKL